MPQLSSFASTASNVATNAATRTITISNEVVAIDGALDPPTGSDDWGGWRIICTSSGGFRSVAGATGTLGGGTQSLTIIEESGGHRFGGDNFQNNTARFSGDQTNRLKYSNIVWIVNTGNRSDFDIYRGTNSNGSLGPSVELTGVWLQQQTASNQTAHFNHYSGNASIKIHSGVGFGLKISNFTNGPAIEFSTPIQSGAVVEGLVIDSITTTNNNNGSRCAVRLGPLPTNGTMTLSNLNTPSIAAVSGTATKNLLLINPVGRPTRADWDNQYRGNFEIRRTVPFTFTGASVPASTTMHAVAQTGGGVNATATMSGTSGSIQVRTDYSANAASGGAWTTQNTYKFAMTALGIQKYSLTTTQTIANSPATITAALTADTLPNGNAISTITAPSDECDTVGEVLRVVKDWEVLNPTLSTAPDQSIVYVNGAQVKFNDLYSVVLNAAATELVGIASNVITIKCSNSSDLATSNGLTTLAATGSSKTITTPSVTGDIYTANGAVSGLAIFTSADNTAITSGDPITVTNTGGWTGINTGTTYYLGKTGFPQSGGFLVGLYDTQAHAIAVGNTGLQSITGSGTNIVLQTPSSTPVTAADDVFFLDSSGQKSVISVLNNMGDGVLFSLINTSNGDTVADTGTTDVADDGTGTILVATKGLTSGYRLVGKRPGYRYFSVAVDLTGGGAFSYTAPEQEEILLADGTGSYLRLIQTGEALEVTDSSTGTTPGMRLNIKNSTTTVRVLFKAIEDFLAGTDGAKFMGLGGQQVTYNQDTLNGDQIYLGANCKVKRRQTTDVNAAVRCSLFAGDGQPIDAANGDVQTIEGINVPALGTALLVNQDFDADDAGTQSIWGQLVAIKTAVDNGGGGGGGGFTATDRTNLGSIKTSVEAVPTAAANASATWGASARTLTTAAGLTSAQATQLSNINTNVSSVKSTVEALPEVDDIWEKDISVARVVVVPSASIVQNLGIPVPSDTAAALNTGDALEITNTGGYTSLTRGDIVYIQVQSNNQILLYSNSALGGSPMTLTGGDHTELRLVREARTYGTAEVAIRRITDEVEALPEDVPSADDISNTIWATIVDNEVLDNLIVEPTAKAGSGFRITAGDFALLETGDHCTLANTGGYSGLALSTTYYIFKQAGNQPNIFLYADRSDAIAGNGQYVNDGNNGTATLVDMTFPETKPTGTAGVALRRIREAVADLDADHAAHSNATAAIGVLMNQLLGEDFVETDVNLQKAMRILLAIMAGRSTVSSNGTTYTWHRLVDDTAILRGRASDSGRTVPTIDPT